MADGDSDRRDGGGGDGGAGGVDKLAKRKGVTLTQLRIEEIRILRRLIEVKERIIVIEHTLRRKAERESEDAS